jgi:hypothetical protein
MARGNLKPVSVAGIEADALISEEISYSADIPEYPVEKGYNVSDTIILKPVSLSLTLFISDTPATWSGGRGHKPSAGRTQKICKKFEDLYFKRKLVKVVTSDKIYTNMGITSMSISHSKELGYARQISMSLKKVYVTKKRTVKIPKYVLQSGETKANAGKASTSKSSSNSSGSSSGSGSKGSSSSKSSSGSSESTKKSSILYGIASKSGFI